MPGHNNVSADNALFSESPTAEPDWSQPATMVRWGGLIAEGFVPFPGNLNPTIAEQLASIVRERRRQQLVRFVAQQLALQWHAERTVKGENDAQKEI